MSKQLICAIRLILFLPVSVAACVDAVTPAAEVETFVPAGASPHTYEILPAQWVASPPRRSLECAFGY